LHLHPVPAVKRRVSQKEPVSSGLRASFSGLVIPFKGQTAQLDLWLGGFYSLSLASHDFHDGSHVSVDVVDEKGKRRKGLVVLLTGQDDSLLSSLWGGGKLGYDLSTTSPIMTNGPNSLTTIAPKLGSPQPVLGPGTNYNVSFLGKLAKAGAELKLAVDAGLSGALVLNCSLGQIR